jgi:hypothetical protein
MSGRACAAREAEPGAQVADRPRLLSLDDLGSAKQRADVLHFGTSSAPYATPSMAVLEGVAGSAALATRLYEGGRLRVGSPVEQRRPLSR